MLKEAEHLLPEAVLDMIDVIGFEAAEKLVKSLGGVTFFIGKGVQNTPRLKMLEAVIGVDATLALIEVFGGDSVYIPRCDAALRHLRNQRLISDVNEAVANGTSISMALLELCPKYGISDRLAWDILNAKKDTQIRQQTLV